MIPIQELLNRIRWDVQFARGEFEIGYFDRVEDRIIRVPFREVYFDADDDFTFQVTDADGVVHSIPLHRVKEVVKDGELIWHREH
jgi:uncharacterized protein (UPF0248 family)